MFKRFDSGSMMTVCLLVYVIVGFLQVANKFLAVKFDAYGAFFIVYVTALLACTGYLAGRGIIRPRRCGQPVPDSRFADFNARQRFSYVGIILLGQVIAPLLYFSAINITSIFTQSLVYFLYPVLTTLGGQYYFKEKGSVLTYTGSVILLSSYALYLINLNAGHADNLFGILLLFGSALALFLQKMIHKGLLADRGIRFDDGWLSFWGLLAGTLTAAGLLLATQQFYFYHFFSKPQIWGRDWGVYFSLVVVIGLIYSGHHFLRNNMLRHLDLTKMFPLSVFIPISALIFSIVFYRGFPQDFPYYPINFVHLFCMMAMAVGAALIMVENRLQGLQRKLRKHHLRYGLAAILLTLLLFVGLRGLLIAPVRSFNKMILSKNVHQAAVDLIVNDKLGRVKEVQTAECKEPGFPFPHGYYVITGQGSFLITCDYVFQRLAGGGETHLGVVSLFNVGSVIAFDDPQGKQALRVRYLQPMGSRDYLLKGVDIRTGKLVVFKRVAPAKIKMNEVLAQAKRTWQEQHPRNEILRKILTGRHYTTDHRGYQEDYLITPFLTGKTFFQYFGYDVRKLKTGTFDLRPQSRHLLEKILEVGEIAKLFYRFGLYNRDISKKNLMIHSRDLSVTMIDFEFIFPLDDVQFSSYSSYNYNFLDLLYLIYPEPGDAGDPVAPPTPRPYLLMTDQRTTNDWINRKLKLMVEKIEDNSYIYERNISATAQGREGMVQAMDAFLSDLQSIYDAVVTGKAAGDE